MSYISFDGYLVDFCQEAGLVGIGVVVDIFWFKIKKSLFGFFLLAAQRGMNFLQIDDPVDLSSSQLYQSIFAGRANAFLVHMKFLPILWQAYLFGSLKEVAFFRMEGGCIYFNEVIGDLRSQRFTVVVVH